MEQLFSILLNRPFHISSKKIIRWQLVKHSLNRNSRSLCFTGLIINNLQGDRGKNLQTGRSAEVTRCSPAELPATETSRSVCLSISGFQSPNTYLCVVKQPPRNVFNNEQKDGSLVLFYTTVSGQAWLVGLGTRGGTMWNDTDADVYF